MGGDAMHEDEAGSADFELERILRQEMSELLASPYFIRSPVQCRLLRYLVNHRLRGDLPSPKAYAIATQALGRPADFDPSTDSYPRVMVGRLRSLLERYYSERPWLYRLRIPQGSYEVVVQYRSSPPSRSAGGEAAAAASSALLARERLVSQPIGFSPAATAPLGGPNDRGAGAGFESLAALLDPAEESENQAAPTTRWGRICNWLDEVLPQPNELRKSMVMIIAISLAAMLGGGAALLAKWYGDRTEAATSLNRSANAKAYVPLPLVDVQVRAADRQDVRAKALAEAVQARMRDGGRRFEMLSLMGGEAADGRTAKPDYRIEVVLVPASAGRMDAVVMLHRMVDQRSIWSRRYAIGPDDGPSFASLDPAIVEISGNYGAIVRDQAMLTADDYRAGFPCLAQFQRMRVAQQFDAVDKVTACLSDAAAENPRDPVTLSAHSYMLHHAAVREKDKQKAQALTANGLAQAAAAYAAEPSSAHAAFAQARAYFVAGRCSISTSMGRRAEEGNPLDADMLSRLAIIHQMCGDEPRADILSARALELDRAFPAVSSIARASILLAQDQPQLALDQLAGLVNVQPVTAHYHVLHALALARLERRAEAREHWNRLIALAGMPENARAEDVLRHFSVVDIIVRREAALLRDAGVVPLRTAD